MITRKRVEVLIIKDDKVCIGKYSRDGTTWYSPPGGTVDFDNSYVETAICECLEEVGILIKKVRTTNIHHTIANSKTFTRSDRSHYDFATTEWLKADYYVDDKTIFNIEGDGVHFEWLTEKEALTLISTNTVMDKQFIKKRLDAIVKAFQMK